MKQTTVNVRVDEDLKRDMEDFCNAVGMNISTAVNMFFKAVMREHKIPFEVGTDPLYSGANYQHIMQGIRALENGEPGIVKTIEELEAMENE